MLKYPTECSDHSQGAHHILYHFYWVDQRADVIGNLVVLGDMEMRGRRINVIAGLLVCSDMEHLWHSEPIDGLNVDCVNRISDLCRVVKQQPASMFLLLNDIAVKTGRWTCYPSGVGLILEAVEQAMALPEDNDSLLLLRPLARAIDVLQQSMPTYKEGEALERESVARHAQRIAGLLNNRSVSRVITSRSHIQILSCARGSTSVQPAMIWLPMYIER